ncbi:MAG: hypothetical protein ACE5GB_02390 [Acidimicrobiales bacterium]
MLTELRGFLAFAAVVALIGLLWTRLDREPADTATATTTLAATTTTTRTPSSTTTTPEQAVAASCGLAEGFAAEMALLAPDEGPGPVARLAAELWTELLDLLPADIRTEVVAVVDYYEAYLEVAEPFDHDPVRIILEGDKERYEQLVTRPAPGLDNARGFLLFECGVEVPDQPSMSASAFVNLEDRLFGND